MPKKFHGRNPEGAARDRRQAARERKTAVRRQNWGDGEKKFQVESNNGCVVSAIAVGVGVVGALGTMKGWL